MTSVCRAWDTDDYRQISSASAVPSRNDRRLAPFQRERPGWTGWWAVVAQVWRCTLARRHP